MASIPHDVVSAFVVGQYKRRGSFVSHGTSLYSYNRLIATRDDRGRITIHLPDEYYASSTTNIHLSACEGLTGDDGRRIVKLGPRTWGVRNNTNQKENETA